MVYLAQTMHQSCTETNTISKRTKSRFQITHVIKKVYLVCSNWFMSIWYVPCKPCTYLASRLALYPNRPNWAFTLAPLPRSTSPKWVLILWCIRSKPCTYFAPKLTQSPNISKQNPYDTRHLGVPSGASKLISKHMVCSMQTVHQSCIKIRTISK